MICGVFSNESVNLTLRINKIFLITVCILIYVKFSKNFNNPTTPHISYPTLSLLELWITNLHQIQNYKYRIIPAWNDFKMDKFTLHLDNQASLYCAHEISCIYFRAREVRTCYTILTLSLNKKQKYWKTGKNIEICMDSL